MYKQNFAEQLLKLHIMGFEAIEVKNRSGNVDEIHFVNKKHITNYKEVYASKSDLFKRHSASFIFCKIKNEWIKERTQIPLLTQTEKVLYGR